MKYALSFALSLVLSVSVFAQVSHRAPKEGATPTRTINEAPSAMTIDLMQIDSTPSELERLLGAVEISAAQREKLLRTENQTEVNGPVTILQPMAPSKAVTAKQATTSLLSATNTMLFDDGIEQGDSRSDGLYGLDAGSDVFPGDRVVSGILVNPGPSIVVLQTNSGDTLTVDPGALVLVAACASACSTTCSSGSYSCCGIDRGCARCACVMPGGPTPSWQCASGGAGTSECSIAAN